MTATQASSTVQTSDTEKTWPIIIIGSGFGGQAAAINLLKKGKSDFLILERRDFMGGTWQQNTYPGAAVDVQSPLYSLSDEPYQWSQMFAEGDELQEYTNHVIEKYQLRSKTRIKANVSEVRWQADEDAWHVKLKDGKELRSRILINASGPLSTPVIPNFKGKDTFKGKSFHTNNWDHDYDYKGKRVAIIGSGASAAQVIPTIAGDVGHLHVFQRSPHWVIPRPDRTFSKFERKLLGFKPLYKALRYGIYWGLETRVVGFKYSEKMLEIVAQRRAEKMLEEQVADPELRKKLTPDFTIGCKRVIISSTLYPALVRNNVTLHDKHDGIQEITETGIITAQGEHIELDLIIYSTGYDATDGVISYPVIGKEGKSIADVWSEFPRAYLGTAIPGFPNLFIVTGPNTGIGHTSAIFVIESQMLYIMKAIGKLLDGKHKTIEVTAEAEQRYTTMIHDEMKKTVWKTGGCNSWYQSKSGHVIAMFPGFSFSYRLMAMNFKNADHAFS